MLGPTAAAAAAAAGAAASSSSSVGSSTRHRAIGLYKELLRLGRDYPDPTYGFERRVRESFRRNTHLIELPEIDQKLTLAAHVRDETLALIQLAKYRYLRRTYVASAEMGREDPFATVASRAEAEAARAAKPGLAGQKATDKA